MKKRAVATTGNSVNQPLNHASKLFCLVVLTALTAASSASAANQTWTNAPVSSAWQNTNNWVSKTNTPGAINVASPNVQNDIATFNSPIPLSGIGGASNPILIDDSTNGNRSRNLGSIIFDTASCGAYVIDAATKPVSYPSNGILFLSNTNSITVNSTVVNPQTILAPIYTVLPNSTAGVYSFVNNSANPAATLFIQSATNASATSRGTVWTLDGSNTGTNTVAALSAGFTTTGANGVTKQGTGTWILPGLNDFRGTGGTPTLINVNNGTLVVQNAGSFNGAPVSGGNAPVIQSNGVLEIDGVTLTQLNLNLRLGGTIRMNGTGLVNGVTFNTSLGNSGSLATTFPTDLMTVGYVANALTGGAYDTLLHVKGPGTVELLNQANYAGNWSVDAGTLKIDGGGMLGTGGNLNIAAGATFMMTNLGPSTYQLDTAGISGSGTGTTVGTTAAAIFADPAGILDLASTVKNISLTYAPTSFSGDTTHPALYMAQGTLTLGGNTITVNNASGTPLGVGTYTLIQQASGSITANSGFAVVVVGSGLAVGTTASIQVSGGSLNMVVFAYTAKNLVWQGGNNANAWDVNNTPNFLNGASASVFMSSDNVTFNSTGQANSPVSLAGVLSPGSVVVDTSGGNYAFDGTGKIAGTTGLSKIGSGTLLVQNANSYLGTTAISGGTLQLGVPNALSLSSATTITSPGILDMNGQAASIDGLNGTGTIDNTSGGAASLSVGNNNGSGNVSGIIQNSGGGALSLIKNGLGTLTLSGANTYSGGTTLNVGSIVLGNASALGSGSALTVNAGILDLTGKNVTVASLSGAGGTITNSGTTTTTTNGLTITNTSGGSFSGVIAENRTGSKEKVVVLGNNELRFNGPNAFSGGIFVGQTATIGTQPGGSFGTGPLTMSNLTTMFLHQSGGAPTVTNTIIIPDNSTISNNSTALGNFFNGLVVGGPTATYVVMGGQGLTLGAGTNQFQNFTGTVIAESNIRWGPGTGQINGGDNTTFVIPAASRMQHRGTGGVSLGYITGTGLIDGAQNSSGFCNIFIGAKGVDDFFEGGFTQSNNLVKVGHAKLIFDGASITTNTDSTSYTNYLYTNIITHVGSTTISNGILGLVVPNTLTNSTNIILAGGTLDATQMGYVIDQVDNISQTVTNQLLATNGVIEIIAGQTNSGFGTIWGHLIADAGSTVSPGLPTGTLTVTNGIELKGATVNISLNRTNAQTSGQLAAAGSSSITITGGTLTVTNVGPDLGSGDVFQLFNKAVTGFTTVNLPTANAANTVVYSIQNNLAFDGSIKVLSGQNYNPTNLSFSVSGSTLHLSWPADHIGWLLSVQTNNLAKGISQSPTNWGIIAGSGGMTSTNITINRTNVTTFYRLVSP